MTYVFVMTDVVGSTDMWERAPSVMPEVLAQHDRLVREAIERAAGSVFKHTGDGMIAVFDDADDACRAALDADAAVRAGDWTPFEELRLRTSIHAGPATRREGDYFGPTLNRVARINATAHPGQVLISDVARGLMTSAKGLDLGEHQLRDLGEPVRLWQLDDGDHPPLVTLRADLHNLPVQLNEFVGRTDELAQVDELLDRHRLVSITGVGGCGKTRLAIEAVAGVSDRYPGGVWFVDLRAVESHDQILRQIASAIGLLTGGEVDSAEEMLSVIAEYAGNQHTLVVLDNCEHVVDDAADVAEDLLHRARTLTLLATTREALGAEGERVWRIPSMSSGTGDAVALFMTRALAADANFELAPGEGEVVEEITRQLDGIPLAIELAAARVAHLSLADLRTRLDERFSLLSGGRRARRQRQQTLQAMMDWSWELLDADEQQMLAELSIFRGGFDQRGVDEVCTAPSSGGRFEVLTNLVDRSLVAAVSTATTSRYQLLETVRLYGLDRLTARGDARTLRDRHADWVRGFCSCTTSLTFAIDELSYAEANVDNVLAALEWLAQNDRTDVVAEVVSARPQLFFVDHNVDGLRWLTWDLVRRPDLPDHVRLASYFTAAQVWMMSGDYDSAARFSTAGCELVDEFDLDGHPATRRWAALNYIASSMHASDHDERVRHYERATEIWPADTPTVHIFDVASGLIRLFEVDYEGIIGLTEPVLDPALHALAGNAVLLMLRGIALSELNRHDEAIEVASLLLDARAARDTPVSTAITQMAFVQQRAGNPQLALDYLARPPATCVGKAVGHWRYGRVLLFADILLDHDLELSARLVESVPPVRTITLGFRQQQIRQRLAESGLTAKAVSPAGSERDAEEVIVGAVGALRRLGYEL